MVIVIGASMVMGGFGLGIEPLSGAWWLTRPLWFAVLAAVTFALVSILGRFERPAPERRPAPSWWQPLIAVAFACAGLGLLAAIGIADEDGLNGIILTLPLAGVILGGVVDLRRDPDRAVPQASDRPA